MALVITFRCLQIFGICGLFRLTLISKNLINLSLHVLDRKEMRDKW